MGVGIGGRVRGHAPPWIFTHSLLYTSQISNFFSFLVVNTGSIFIGPPENFSAEAYDSFGT